MISKLIGAVSGYKTYILAGLGVIIALAGHFFGPFQIASQTIPQFSWGDVWNVIWHSGLFAALRAGVDKASA